MLFATPRAPSGSGWADNVSSFSRAAVGLTAARPAALRMSFCSAAWASRARISGVRAAAGKRPINAAASAGRVILGGENGAGTQ